MKVAMLGISVWQPWASLIAAGAKRYETRGWRPPATLIGQRLAICSSKTMVGIEQSAQDLAFYRLCLRRLGRQPLPMGAVVAVVTVTGCISTTAPSTRRVGARERLAGDWSEGRWAWSLGDVRPLPRPIPVLGSQKLFYLPARVLAQVMAQIGAPS